MIEKVKFDSEILKKFLKSFWFAPCDAFLRAIEACFWKDVEFAKPVLAIGIGDGRYDKLLFEGKKINIGIDNNPKAILKARKTRVYGKVIANNAERIRLKNETINTIVSNSTFEHIKNDEIAVKEVSRLLKKDGHFIFSIPTLRVTEALKEIGVSKKKIEKFDKRVEHLHYRDLLDWQRILNMNKMEMIEHYYYMPKESFKVWWKLYKIQTFKPYHRELWSYLKDSPYGKLVPKKIVIFLLEKYLKNHFTQSLNKNGVWLFIVAKKIG